MESDREDIEIPFERLDMEAFQDEYYEFQLKCKAEAAEVRDYIYRFCDELKEYADHYMEDVLQEQYEQMLDLVGNYMKKETKVFKEYRDTMTIKAQFAELVQQLADGTSEASQRSIKSDRFDHTDREESVRGDLDQGLCREQPPDQEMVPVQDENDEDECTIIEN